MGGATTTETAVSASTDRATVTDGLAQQVGPVHRDALRLASWMGEETSGADPRQIHRAGDAVVAAMCAHLATMNQVLYPEVARRLPHTEGRLARLRAGAHEMLLMMRGIQQYAQGDPHPPGGAVTELYRDLAAQISEHGREEEALLGEFDEAATADERRLLVAEYERMLSKAPSRPHPYLLGPGRPVNGRLGYRMVGLFDNLLDTMDGRVIPWAKVRGPGEVGPWGTWLLGRPPQASSSESSDDNADARTATYATRTGSAPGPDASQSVSRAPSPRG